MNKVTQNQIINNLKLRNQFFPSHLVERSIWPLFLSLSLFSLAIGAVQFFHGYSLGTILTKLSFIIVTIGALLWWKDISNEASLLGDHTKRVKFGIWQGFILFLVSEAMAFLSVFWAYMHSSLSPSVELGLQWPPVGIETLDTFGLPLLNTLLLLSSAAFITWAHHALIFNNRLAVITGTFATIVLAVVFTYFQYVEYISASFSFACSAYGSTFFAATGLHGIHVIIGTLFIFIQFIRFVNYYMTSTHHLGKEAAILYWHFVDVIWIILFVIVYYWGGASV